MKHRLDWNQIENDFMFSGREKDGTEKEEEEGAERS